MPDRFRGHIELVLDPVTGKVALHGLLALRTRLPEQLHPRRGRQAQEGAKDKSVTEYHLNFTTCSLCGSCIEACPFDAIQFSKVYNVVGTFAQ